MPRRGIIWIWTDLYSYHHHEQKISWKFSSFGAQSSVGLVRFQVIAADESFLYNVIYD